MQSRYMVACILSLITSNVATSDPEQNLSKPEKNHLKEHLSYHSMSTFFPTGMFILLGYLSYTFFKKYCTHNKKLFCVMDAKQWSDYTKKLFPYSDQLSYKKEVIRYYPGYLHEAFCIFIGLLECPDNFFDEIKHCIAEHTHDTECTSKALIFYKSLSLHDKKKFIKGLKKVLVLHEQQVSSHRPDPENPKISSKKPAHQESLTEISNTMSKSNVNEKKEQSHAYCINQKTKKKLLKKKLPFNAYEYFVGLPEQHILHKECLYILDNIAHNKRSQSFDDIIASFVSIAHAYNSHGFMQSALKALDVCWSIIACSSCAIIEGTVQGLSKTVTQINNYAGKNVSAFAQSIEHATDCIIQFMYDNPALTGNLLYNVGRNEDISLKDAVYKIAKNLKQHIKNNPYRSLKELSSHTVQTLLSYKATYALYRLIIHAHQRLKRYMNKSKTPLTSEFSINDLPTVIIKHVYEKLFHHETRKNLDHLDNLFNEYTATYTMSKKTTIDIIHKDNFIPLEYEIPLLKKTFNKTRKGIGSNAHRYITISLKNIFGVCYHKHKKKLHIDTFCHDFMGRLESMGIISYVNKVYAGHGIYKADILVNNIAIYENKVFFPQEWPRSLVIEKIYEAYDNFLAQNLMGIQKNVHNNYSINSLTNDGIQINIRFNKKGKIITAHPIFLDNKEN